MNRIWDSDIFQGFKVYIFLEMYRDKHLKNGFSKYSYLINVNIFNSQC